MIKYIAASQLTLEGFNTPFDNKLSPRNRWVVMAGVIPWDKLASIYYRRMASSTGVPTLSARMVIGAVIIKHILNIDDGEVVQQIQENIYLQYFVGLSSFQIEAAFDPSLLVAIRMRLGKTVMDQFNELILKESAVVSSEKEVKAKFKKEVNQPTKDNTIQPETIAENPVVKTEPPINKEHLPIPNSGTLMVDATVAEQQIDYPTDVKLLNECRQQLERIITTGCIALGIDVPWMYKKIARKKYLNLAKKKRKSAKDIRRSNPSATAIREKRSGYIDALMNQSAVMDEVLTSRDWELLDNIRKTYRQPFSMFTQQVHSIENRIVSIYQPHVRPIPRGKDKVSTEFGSKQLIMLKDGFTQVQAISWDNFNEGTRLQECLETYKAFYGCYPEKVQADQIFGNRDNRAYMKQRGIKYIGRALGRPTAESRQQEGLIQKQMAQRNAIKEKFGQVKNAYGLAKIKARLKDTSEGWISSIYFVMNLLKLVQVHFLSFFYKLLYHIWQLVMNIKWNNAEILTLESDGRFIQV